MSLSRRPKQFRFRVQPADPLSFPFISFRAMYSALVFALLPVVFSKSVNTPFLIAPCPTGSRPLLRPDGEPRKCLPHQNRLCVNALPDRPNARTVCCFNNQVDYFCCLDTRADQCPDYQHVTVVIHNSSPHNPFALKSFFFREGIEDDIVDATMGEAARKSSNDGIQQEDGFLVRHNRNNQ